MAGEQTSGVIGGFTLPVDELIDTAISRSGGQTHTGGDEERARKELNLVLIQLQNRNIPISKIQRYFVDIVPDQNEYTLPLTVSKISKISLQTDTGEASSTLTRYSRSEFHDFSGRDTQKGYPSAYTVFRDHENVRVVLFPTPTDTHSGYKLDVLAQLRVEDVVNSYELVGIPTKYLPLIELWLSYKLALSKPGVLPDSQYVRLEQAYKDEMNSCFEDDTEQVDYFVKPYYRRIF